MRYKKLGVAMPVRVEAGHGLYPRITKTKEDIMMLPFGNKIYKILYKLHIYR